MLLRQGESSSVNPFELSRIDLKVLLVEDQWADQRLISKILKSLGCQVTVAQNLQEAGHLLENTAVNMVLLNSSIYSQNGYDFSAMVENTERRTGKKIPVIGLDGDFMKTKRDQSMANGMDEYLPKPVSENELFRVMVKLAGNSQDLHAPSRNLAPEKGLKIAAI